MDDYVINENITKLIEDDINKILYYIIEHLELYNKHNKLIHNNRLNFYIIINNINYQLNNKEIFEYYYSNEYIIIKNIPKYNLKNLPYYDKNNIIISSIYIDIEKKRGNSCCAVKQNDNLYYNNINSIYNNEVNINNINKKSIQVKKIKIKNMNIYE